MSAHVLLNSLIELKKADKMRDFAENFFSFLQQV